ncbi:MAG: hypothetical protein AB8G14_18345 [Ilumatobacter sp.]
MIAPPTRTLSGFTFSTLRCWVLGAATMWSLVACGGGSDASPTVPTSAPATASPADTEPEPEPEPGIAAPDTVSAGTAAPATAAPTTPAPIDVTPERGSTPFDGPLFTVAANARMDQLAVTFGLPVSAEAVLPIFELPADFPYPQGAITGIFHEYSLDERIDGELQVEEERHVGIDAPGDATTVDSVLLAVESAPETRWERKSFQRDSFNNDLYTAPPLDGGELNDRMVIRGVDAPEPDEPSLQVRLEQRTADVAVPSWKTSLPTLEGGVLSDVREGLGVVESFGTIPQGGYIEMREFYDVDRFAELEAFFASGIIESAGFDYEDTPFNNFSIRIDISSGDWSGTVGVGEIVIDGELAGYQLIWSLSRAA